MSSGRRPLLCSSRHTGAAPSQGRPRPSPGRQDERCSAPLLRAAAPRRCSAPRSAPPLSASLRGEEEMVLELMRFTEMVGVSLSVQSRSLNPYRPSLLFLCSAAPCLRSKPCVEAAAVFPVSHSEQHRHRLAVQTLQGAELLCRSLAMRRVPCLEAMIIKSQLVTFVLVVSDHDSVCQTVLMQCLECTQRSACWRMLPLSTVCIPHLSS